MGIRVESVPIDSLKNGNDQQREFLEELDAGVNPFKTGYYRRLRDYRQRTGSGQQTWTKEKLTEYMHERVALYEDIKKNGMREPLKVRRKDDRIMDGNHRHAIWKHLGHKTILVKKYEKI